MSSANLASIAAAVVVAVGAVWQLSRTLKKDEEALANSIKEELASRDKSISAVLENTTRTEERGRRTYDQVTLLREEIARSEARQGAFNTAMSDEVKSLRDRMTRLEVHQENFSKQIADLERAKKE